ncbi:MAG: hypothetical protein DLM61_15230 [Pseudonocardiales bacterium]|nr:MAG: hypothetical protein DLM61_15230 [Pseudonocardiales bacterium]
MDTVAPRSAGQGPTPEAWGDTAQLPVHVVAREHPRQWADSGLPDSLADLDAPLETVWAAVKLALSGADQHTLASTLGLSDDSALRIIVATTEQLLADPATVDTTRPETTDMSPPPAHEGEGDVS